MKHLIVFGLIVSILLLPLSLKSIGIPTFDFSRITSFIAQYVPNWAFWAKFLPGFEGGDGYTGLLKLDDLLTKNIMGSLESINLSQYTALFNETLADFQQTFLSTDYYKSLLTDAVKELLTEMLEKTFEKDVMSDKVLRGNSYYAHNPKMQAAVDQTMEHKKEIYGKLIAMSKEMEVRSQTDQQDLDRYRMVCEYIDQIDKDKTYWDAANMHEMVMLFSALQNEEIQVNRSMLEMLRSIYELDIYKQLEAINDL